MVITFVTDLEKKNIATSSSKIFWQTFVFDEINFTQFFSFKSVQLFYFLVKLGRIRKTSHDHSQGWVLFCFPQVAQ
jgi:hypothetical protein